MCPDEIETPRFRKLCVGFRVGRIEAAFQVGGKARYCQLAARVAARAAAGHRIKDGGRLEESEQVLNVIAAAIAGIVAAAVFTGAAEMVGAGEVRDGTPGAGRRRKFDIDQDAESWLSE